MRLSIKKLLSITLIVVMVMTLSPFINGGKAYAKTNSKPGKIKSIKIVPTEKSASISWSKSKRAKKYQVIVKLKKKKIKSVTTKKRVLTLKKLKKNKKYSVSIRGVRGKVKGKWKKTTFITVVPKKQPAKQQVAPTNYDITLGDIEDKMTSGAIDAGYNDYGTVQYIYGKFSSLKVTNEASAVKLMDHAQSLIDNTFDAYDCDVEQTKTELNSSVYRFNPYYQGIPIEGSGIVLEASNTGNVEGLYNTYNGRMEDVDIYQDIDEEDASAIALQDFLDREPRFIEYYGIDVDEMDMYDILYYLEDEISIDSSLIIYCLDDEETPVLTYKIVLSSSIAGDDNVYETDGAIEESDYTIPSKQDDDNAIESNEEGPLAFNYTYYIYANGDNCGEILLTDDGRREAEKWRNIKYKAKDEFDKTKTINAQKKGDSYRLIDAARKLYTYKAKTSKDSDDYNLLPGTLVEGTAISKKAISAHANMSEVFDYYKRIKRDSFDGSGGSITVTYNYKDNDSTGLYNAFWDPNINQMVFGNLGHFEKALDVVGHEFTHAVISYTANLRYKGESGALNESLADIMGTLIEGKTGTNKWLLGEDSDETLRSLKNPENYSQPSHYSNYDNAPHDEENDYGGVHTNSGIFNHAAYLMMSDSRTSSIDRYKWGSLFLNALDRMSEGTGFLGARYAIVSTARKMKFSDAEMKAINEAFDSVGIKTPARIRVSLRWGANPEDIDLHIVGPSDREDDSRFHVFFDDLKHYNRQGRLAVDLDHDDIDSYGPEIATIRQMKQGTYYVFVHDYTNRDSIFSSYLSASKAQIKVYISDERLPLRIYTIPKNHAGVYWNVCKITIDPDGFFNVTPINSFSEEQVLY